MESWSRGKTVAHTAGAGDGALGVCTAPAAPARRPSSLDSASGTDTLTDLSPTRPQPLEGRHYVTLKVLSTASIIAQTLGLPITSSGILPSHLNSLSLNFPVCRVELTIISIPKEGKTSPYLAQGMTVLNNG